MLSDETLKILGCISTAEEVRKALEEADRPVPSVEFACLEEQAYMAIEERFRVHDESVLTKLKIKL